LRASATSKSSAMSARRSRKKKRVASAPASSSTSRSVTKFAARLLILNGFALLEQVHQLQDEHLQLAAHRKDRGLHAPQVTAVVRAPDVDEPLESALQLVQVVCEVGAEVGRLPVVL